MTMKRYTITDQINPNFGSPELGIDPASLVLAVPRIGGTPQSMCLAWAHLPNAKHIDWVMSSLRRDPQVWVAAWDAARGAAWSAAWDAARGAAWDAARGAAWDAAWVAARGDAWSDAWGAARNATRDACAAFIAWDDASDVWAMPTDAVRLLAAVGEPRAALLLPACIVRDQS